MDEDQATCSLMKRDVKTIGPIFSAIFKRFLDVFERKREYIVVATLPVH